MKEEKSQPTSILDLTNPTYPSVLPIVPLRDIVIFPYMMYPILAGRESTIKAVNSALESHKYLLLITQKDPTIEETQPDNLYSEGTVGRIIQVIKLPNNLIKVLVDGIIPAKAIKIIPGEFFTATIDYKIPKIEMSQELDALVRQATKLFTQYVQSNRNIAQESIIAYENIPEPDRKLYYIASILLVPIKIRQKLLQIENLTDQYYEIISILSSELEISKVEKDIETKINSSMQKNQRRFIVQE